MDFLSNFANINNFTAIVLIAVLLLLSLGIFKGKIAFKGHGLQIGKDVISPASRIKQLQWDYLQAETEIALRNLPALYLEEPKKWRTHYVVGKYRDVLQLAIINNNITSDEEYIESKQILSYSAILKATQDDYFKSPEFKELIYSLTEKIIKQFCKIKNKYEDC